MGTTFIDDNSRPKVRSDYKAELTSLLSQGRRGDMVELFFTEAVGMPTQFVVQMRQAPWRSGKEALAQTTIYDATIMGDYSLPRSKVARIQVRPLSLMMVSRPGSSIAQTRLPRDCQWAASHARRATTQCRSRRDRARPCRILQELRTYRH
jgi:hypothetical protein